MKTSQNRDLSQNLFERTSVTRLCNLSDIYELSHGERVPEMEGLRGFAILLVFLVHYYSVFGGFLDTEATANAISGYIAVLGNSGVDLFFVISGFLIYGMLLRKSVNLPSFLWRRVVRIYPTFGIVFITYGAVASILPQFAGRLPEGRLSLVGYLLENLLLLPGVFPIHPLITVAWSLSFEFAYYLTVPVLMIAVLFREWPRRTRICTLIAISASYLIISTMVFDGALARMTMFGGGMLAVEFQPFFKSRPWDIGIIAGLLAISCCATHHAEVSREAIFAMAAVPSLLVAYVLLLLDISAAPRGVIGRTLSRTPLRWLGNISYSYYLIHGMTILALAVVARRFIVLHDNPVFYWIGMPLAFLATWIAATVLFLSIEKPLSLRPRGPPVRQGGLTVSRVASG